MSVTWTSGISDDGARKVGIKGEWMRGIYLDSTTAVPKKVNGSNNVPDGVDYQSFPVELPAEGKAWVMARFEMGVPSNTRGQNLTLNGNDLGLYVDNGNFGSVDVLQNFGRGILVLPSDTFIVRHSNTSGNAQDISYGIFVWEYDI